jgi:hypothetical protein
MVFYRTFQYDRKKNPLCRKRSGSANLGNPRPLLDFQVAKKLWNNKGEIKLNVSDILNRHAKFYHDLNNNKKYDSADALAIDRVTGTNVSLTLGYNF